MTTDKIWHSTKDTRYYYIDTDSGKEIDIDTFAPASLPSFYDVMRKDGQSVTLHYQRIKVQLLIEED